MQDSVAVAAVTFDRPDDVRTLLKALGTQSHPIASTTLVDSGAHDVANVARAAMANVNYIRSETNLGGAGGFSLAILAAMASGAQWIWIMDDDAHPEDPDCLRDLLDAAVDRGLDVILPLVVSPSDAGKLSFPFRIDGHLTHDRAAVEALGFLPGIGQFFNGALIRRDVFFRVGLPDLRLFIRGDETDFMLRLRHAGVEFGTYTGTALSHPPGWGEVRRVLGDRLHVLVPETAFKRYFYFRNRGYLTRRYRRPKSFAADMIGYPLHFLRTRDLSGLRSWFASYYAGLRGRTFGPPTDQDF